MQFVVEATSIAHRLTVLVSEKEVHNDDDDHDHYHDHDDDHHDGDDEDEDVDHEGDVHDDSHLLHKVVAVVLQLAHEVPSLRDEDCRKDYL